MRGGFATLAGVSFHPCVVGKSIEKRCELRERRYDTACHVVKAFQVVESLDKEKKRNRWYY